MNNVVWVFLIYVWVKKCVEICVMMLKMFKSVFELTYQHPLVFLKIKKCSQNIHRTLLFEKHLLEKHQSDVLVPAK